MGNRFLTERFMRSFFSEKKRFLLLNESGYTHHRSRPYGLSSKKICYANIFEKKHTTRLGNMRRVAKKAMRQRKIEE